MTQFAQLLANGIVTGSVIALAAVGISLVYGILRIVNFAHGDYLTAGAYAAFLVNVTWGGNMVLATVAAIVAVAALGIALEEVLWKPMRRKGAGMFTLFVTGIGLALVLRHVLFLVASAEPRVYDVDVLKVYEVAGVRLSQTQVIGVAISLVALLATALLLVRTPIGKAMRAVADDAGLAAISGIDVDRVVRFTWLLAGALAGLAGVLAGLLTATFDPNLGFMLLLPVFAAVVLGGIGSAYGALLGGLALGVAMELSTWESLAGGLSPVWKPVVAFVLLVAVLLLRPTGLFGKAATT
jgi:branched-subunit amino acid ABC-type transport system permease component